MPGSLVTAPVTITPGFGPEDAGSPCGLVVHQESNAAMDALTTAAVDDPLALCLRIRAATGKRGEAHHGDRPVAPGVPNPASAWRPDPS